MQRIAAADRERHHTYPKPEILPCPFCGEPRIQVQAFEHVSAQGLLFGYRVFCLCSAQVEDADYTHHEDFDQRRIYDEAIALWNARSQHRCRWTGIERDSYGD